ncbi:ABC transporter substrate-binding protein [Desulfobulbus alkaliphilus]|uniref:ABC transporter substrate-binding protein n=1 Tax=Desulfobulbus alkaliphilus TaxID=869814 RepID=UPI001963A629|nr:ABC transporter substrate-binding protein [Desulfobulbus alkaliphilus]MBM9538661.1 ABC transporter substrate-binding protein [Desulfobulbus alkaliphilus]
MKMSTLFLPLTAILLILGLCACDGNRSATDDGTRPAFLQIGEFAVNRLSAERIDVRDGAGRTLVLIPRDAPMPTGVDPNRVVRIPVERVVAYGYFEVATLLALGVLDETLVGVTTPQDRWYIPEVRRGMEEGRIAFIGDASAIDFERLKLQQPELVLTWDPSIIPLLNTLNIPVVVTTTPQAMCLGARMSFVKFLAPFFHREQEAEAFFNRIDDTLRDIRARTAAAPQQPKVMWGDVYEKRVMVEPGNSWVGELVGLAQSNYQFRDIFGASCIEISVERFLYSGQDADILFTYRDRKSGATSKEALGRLNALIKDIAPLKPEGRVYAPLPHYHQSGDKLDEILFEISAILHPELYPGYRLRYFDELPDTDPVITKDSAYDHF